MEELAARLEMDLSELRPKNASKPGDLMARLCDHPARPRADGRGVGIAIGGWPGGTAYRSAGRRRAGSACKRSRPRACSVAVATRRSWRVGDLRSGPTRPPSAHNG